VKREQIPHTCPPDLFAELTGYFTACLRKAEAAAPGDTYPAPSMRQFWLSKGIKPRQLAAMVKQQARRGDNSGINAVAECSHLAIQIANIAAAKGLRPIFEVMWDGCPEFSDAYGCAPVRQNEVYP
jgi:hypothetical protein